MAGAQDARRIQSATRGVERPPDDPEAHYSRTALEQRELAEALQGAREQGAFTLPDDIELLDPLNAEHSAERRAEDEHDLRLSLEARDDDGAGDISHHDLKRSLGFDD